MHLQEAGEYRVHFSAVDGSVLRVTHRVADADSPTGSARRQISVNSGIAILAIDAAELAIAHSNLRRGFHHTGGAWYGALVDERDRVTMGFYSPEGEGGTSGEFSVSWLPLGGKISPKIEAWDDAWSTMQLFADVLAKMAERDDEKMNPLELCELLKSCGVEDLTAYKDPKATGSASA